jgi:hypothetical protein
MRRTELLQELREMKFEAFLNVAASAAAARAFQVRLISN